jgi:hypothetical protein
VGEIMTIEELRQKLDEIAIIGGRDPEVEHSAADELLVRYINDPEVTKIYGDIEKWYA